MAYFVCLRVCLDVCLVVCLGGLPFLVVPAEYGFQAGPVVGGL